ncbi:Cytochrome oxidase assembly protein shy1 [Cytospora mali]|uniref:SURF1-like protein n=1 Tax=Cytospora mali TaxID=578113 RepID=A0A194VF45_CYTMA|nr:Cytochrome oxidase assembly protein shy1 [Valsa mali var. pyri (nom. inval.)]
MKAFTRLARPSAQAQRQPLLQTLLTNTTTKPRRTPQVRRPFSQTARRRDRPQPADDPNFQSILDNPPQLVRAGGKRHGPGLIILAIIPVTAFLLGSWQEMLVGPRMRDGEDGYMVVTPLERKEEGEGSTVLVNRGWIPKRLRDQRRRSKDSMPEGEVKVEGLLRKPWKKNMFTPDNRPDRGEFYFPDVAQMAELSGAQPVWIEATMDPDYMQILEYEQKGIPLGRPAEVNLRNNHAQYIFTWYSLSFATSIMLWMVIKKPPTDVAKRVRMNKHW